MARIYQTPTMGEAHLKVAIVNTPGKADLCVHRVTTWGQARGAALWYLTYQREDANVWVYMTGVGFCDVKVCFVDSYQEAGWRCASHCAMRILR